jgi:hypothetical protein
MESGVQKQAWNAHPLLCPSCGWDLDARPDSILEGKLIYDVRVNIGSQLAAEHPADADTVSPIPDSGITLLSVIISIQA